MPLLAPPDARLCDLRECREIGQYLVVGDCGAGHSLDGVLCVSHARLARYEPDEVPVFCAYCEDSGRSTLYGPTRIRFVEMSGPLYVDTDRHEKWTGQPYREPFDAGAAVPA